MYWMTFLWPWPKVMAVALKQKFACLQDKVRTTQPITTKPGSDIPLVMLITWWDFLETFFFCQISFWKFHLYFCKVKNSIGHISGMVVPIDVKRKGGASLRYCVNYVTLISPMTLTVDFSRSNFKIAVSHEYLIDVKQKESKWIRYGADCMVLSFDHTHDLTPKHYLNGKNGATITNSKDIADEHAAAFTDNSSSTHYSAIFQTVKEQEERVKIDFTSNNTEVYNKPFRLRDLRRAIMKAKPRAPGPDGIHNSLLKHLPEDTLKILKEVLNNIWTSADFPNQWRAATVIPILKPNKDHTDPLSYRPIALTSCLCKVMERMINTRFIWYLEKSGILNRSQCGFRKHHITMDHLVSLERYVRDALARKQQAVGLFFDLEKAYETTWQYGIVRDLHRIGLRGRLPVFVSEYLRDRRIRVRIGTTLSDEFYPEEGVPTGGVLAVTCFGLKIN